MAVSFYSEKELGDLGLKCFGRGVLISRWARFYGVENIEIGDNVRIDDFCILSGRIRMGSHIHISAGVHMFAGSYGIELKDFSTISGRTSLYAQTDDYMGEYMTNSVIPAQFKNVTGAKIIFEKHAIVGACSVILPGAYLAEGVAIGANSLVNSSTEPFCVYAGSPVRKIKARGRGLLEKETLFLQKWTGNNG